MDDWGQAETWKALIASLGPVIQGIAKLKQAFSQPRAGKRDEKKLATEIDEIQNDFQKFADLMATAVKSRMNFTLAEGELFKVMADAHKSSLSQGKVNVDLLGKLAERVTQLTTISLGHERRIKAIESANGRRGKGKKAKGKGKRK